MIKSLYQKELSFIRYFHVPSELSKIVQGCCMPVKFIRYCCMPQQTSKSKAAKLSKLKFVGKHFKENPCN